MTNAQRLILSYVKTRGHYTAENVHSALRQEIPGLALGTVYRNLNKFADEMILRRIRRAAAPDLFEGNMIPHEHIVCDLCGSAVDFDAPEIAGLVEQKVGAKILSAEIIATYICPSCRENQLG